MDENENEKPLMFTSLSEDDKSDYVHSMLQFDGTGEIWNISSKELEQGIERLIRTFR